MLAHARASDHVQRKRLAQQEREAVADELNNSLVALLPWKGDISELLNLAVPDDALLERWKTSFSDAIKEVELQEREVLRLEAEVARIGADTKNYTTVPGLVSDADAARFRTKREEAWSLHRAALDQATPPIGLKQRFARTTRSWSPGLRKWRKLLVSTNLSTTRPFGRPNLITLGGPQALLTVSLTS